MSPTETGLPPDRLATIQGHVTLAERWRVVWRVTIGVAMLTILALTIVTVTQMNNVVHAIRQSQTERAPIIDQTAKAAHAARAGVNILRDCLTPGGDCYERSQANQKAILATVRQFMLDTTSCSARIAQPTDETALTECVNQLQRKRLHDKAGN